MKRNMLCPKCNHEQAGTEVCESCGIYFEKYRSAQLRKDELTNSRNDAAISRQGNSSGARIIPALIVVVAAAGIYTL